MSFSDSFWHRYLGRPYRLHVTDHGGDGPVVILLHGIAASSEKWSNLVPLLSPNYHCITIDLLGFGHSPKPQWNNYSMEDHLLALRKTIKGLRLNSDFTLVGHSLGSLLATRYAAVWPKEIERIVLLSPPVYAPGDSITSRPARARNELLLKVYKFMRTHPIMTPENFKRLSLILPLPKSVVAHPETWTPFFRTLERCIEQQTITRDISRIQAPLMLFYGTVDQVLVPYNIRNLQDTAAVEIRTIRGVNHDVSKRYAAAVAEYLNSLLSPPGVSAVAADVPASE